jgi:hypothetical protein
MLSIKKKFGLLAFSLVVMVSVFSYTPNSVKANHSKTYNLYNASLPSLPWYQTNTPTETDSILTIWGLGQDSGGTYIDSYGSTNTTYLVDPSDKFYINGSTLYSTGYAYTSNHSQEDNGTYTGWSTSDCNAGLAGSNPCYNTGLQYNFSTVENLNNHLIYSYHNVPIYSDSSLSVIAFPATAPSGTSVTFQSPPFVNDMTSPDFRNWWVCVNIPAGTDYTAYRIEVLYGEIEDAFNMSDSTYDQIGNIPITQGNNVSECPIIAKPDIHDLLPNDYHAQINLLDQLGNFITTSSELTFTITSGSKVEYPAGSPDSPSAVADSACESYQKTFSLLSVNVPNPRYEGCILLVALFYTDDGFMQEKFDGLTANLETRIPFVYAFGIREKFENIQTSDNDFAISVPIALAGYNETWEMINTDNARLHQLLDYTRPVLTAILWLGFAWYLLRKGLGVFKSV